MKVFFLCCALFWYANAINIIQKPIVFDEERFRLTHEYIKTHYKIDPKDILIVPKTIVIHHTGMNSLEKSFQKMYKSTLSSDRQYIAKSSNLNVSAHFMVDQDGTIYQLMQDNYMARHIIGLNYSSIGIENIGGENLKDNLTKEQLQANVKLIQHLKKKYPSIVYVIGHYEYQAFEKHPLWLEQDKNYRTQKNDPSIRFMDALKKALKALEN
jgi:beta-N-acetylhexosaminidase